MNFKYLLVVGSFLSVCNLSLAHADPSFEVTHCVEGKDSKGVRVDLQVTRQIRDANGAFVKSGTLNLKVNYAQDFTTLGAVTLVSSRDFTWQRQDGSSPLKYVAQAPDGSALSAQSVPRQVVQASVVNSDLKTLTAGLFNDSSVYAMKLGVDDSQVDDLVVTLQGTEGSRNYHFQAAALNKGGLHPLAQFNVNCTTKFK